MARTAGRAVLLESEGMEILRLSGLRVPRQHVLKPGEVVKDPFFEGGRAVVKVLSPEILHKSDVGGVSIIPNTVRTISDAVQAMEARFKDKTLAGFVVMECIDYRPQLGHELLLGMRLTREYGPVVSLGVGGIYTEFLNKNMLPGRSVAAFAADLLEQSAVERELGRLALAPLITGGLRGQPAMISLPALAQALCRFGELSKLLVAEGIEEFEVNPLVLSAGELVALDALGRFGDGEAAKRPLPRPLGRIKNLLEPRSIALIGVSQKMNPGRVILNNLLRDGFPKDRIFIVKPGLAALEGCTCVSDVKALPETVDLLVVAVGAAQVPELLMQVISEHKAESLLVIPAGFEEKEGNEDIVANLRASLQAARATDWGGPVINGGNCVGIRSQPGLCDTIFIPEYKMPLPKGSSSPLAVVAQSGAFTVARASWLAKSINPRYLISVGNQTDLTIGDYLEYLKDDREIETFAVYVEGFKPGDGLRFIKAAREITDSGRKVILYAAGRTAAGSQAMASHTASVAGDYTVTRELARQAGIALVETSTDFDDLIRLNAFLRGRQARGIRLGAISNAGFDCVAVADNLGSFALAGFSGDNKAALQKLFAESGLEEILDVHNPLDVSPQATDKVFCDAASLILSDPAVDIALIANVPITPALTTLPSGSGHREDFIANAESLPQRMLYIFRNSDKPMVAVLDGGRLYDPLANWFTDNGLPVFRSVAQALKMLELWSRSAGLQSRT
jgi:acyl-CoA synthetase (NDP forming)